MSKQIFHTFGKMPSTVYRNVKKVGKGGVYRGTRYQRGHGLLGSILKIVKPIAKSAAKTALKVGKSQAGNLAKRGAKAALGYASANKGNILKAGVGAIGSAALGAVGDKLVKNKKTVKKAVKKVKQADTQIKRAVKRKAEAVQSIQRATTQAAPSKRRKTKGRGLDSIF